MRRIALFRFIPLFFLAIMHFSTAAERRPAPLPGGMLLHVAVKSPARFLEILDESSAVLTDGTRYALPPGIVSMVAQMYNPFPTGAWDMDLPVDVILLGDDSPKGFGMLVHADGLGAVADDLRKGGHSVEADGESGHDVAEIEDLGTVFLAETADGRVLYADSSDSLETILDAYDDLPLDFWGEGQVIANFNLPPDWADGAFKDIRRAIDRIGDILGNEDARDKNEIREAGINPDVVYSFLGVVEKYAPAFFDEIGGLQNIAADIRLDGERFGVAASLGFPGGFAGATLAETTEKLANLDSPLMKYVDREAAAINVSAPLSALYPDAYGRLRAAAEVFFGEVFPEQKDMATEFIAEFEAAGVGETAVAGYFDFDGQYNASWTKVRDADRLMAAYPGIFAAINAALDKSLLNPDFRFSFSLESLTASDGTEYLKSSLTPERPEALKEIFDLMEESGQPNVEAFRRLLDFTQLIAAKGDIIVVVAGDAGEDELLKAIAAVDAGGDRLMDTDAARDALADLRHRQAAFVLVDSDAILAYIAIESVKNYDRIMSTDVFSEALESILPDLPLSGEMLGFGLGAAGGNLLMDFSVPLHSMNAAIRGYELFSAAIMFNDTEDEDDGGDPDGEYEDDAEDVPQFDEPVGAS